MNAIKINANCFSPQLANQCCLHILHNIDSSSRLVRENRYQIVATKCSNALCTAPPGITLFSRQIYPNSKEPDINESGFKWIQWFLKTFCIQFIQFYRPRHVWFSFVNQMINLCSFVVKIWTKNVKLLRQTCLMMGSQLKDAITLTVVWIISVKRNQTYSCFMNSMILITLQ